MEEINAVTPQQIATLRKNFNDKVASQSPGFHPNDLERVKSDELWMRRFIAHAESNMDTASTLLYECCQWRKDFGTNDLDDTNIPRDLLEKGVLFIRGKDKWGKKLLVFKAQNHTKGTVEIEHLQKLVVHAFERIEKESKSDQISIIFDMTNTGWSNMDMDFVRYLITLLKTYYPYFVNYLVIFSMPWLLNAAWKIIKTWLPEKFVDRVKFQDKKTLKDYIDVDNQLVEWGGTDNYVFKYEPAKKSGRNAVNNNSTNVQNGMETKTKSNRAQFAGNGRTSTEYSDLSPDRASGGTAIPNSSSNNCLVDVEDRVMFRPSESADDEYAAQLTVQNISPNGDALIIKIKTTSPSRYRVKPIIFVLNRNAKGFVSLETHSGVAAATMTKDRFQVQVVIIPQNMLTSVENSNDLGHNFRQILHSGTQFETYRVNVAVEARPGDTGTAGGSIAINDERLRRGLEDLERKITDSVGKQVTAKIDRIERMLMIAGALMVILFACLSIYLWRLTGENCAKSCGGGVGLSSNSISGDL
ncbi:motile sperm domain-containing protein 2 [Folsomia candida]|uniref:Motile sperm domain-containing protein 2 n=1 Tax=Folsomia candida TaxID=158441 RepID=A0A226D0V9_FOLCA|nr:motile sperm domain-containing protein 2 [Folsomia candida]XP_021967091.1 motile sperm domain-containing protein 2 [Folsomia candida]OXA37926.1 Motile sperm domain-containing protein 2 [Folsomia candida]